MNHIITYNSILSMCRELSSFEGRRLIDSQGESIYPEVLITAQDEPFITRFIKEGASAIHSAIRYALADVSADANKVSFSPVVGNGLERASDATKLLTETLAMYVMQRWLADKADDRAKAYALIYDNMLASLTRVAHRKYAPTLSDYDD